MKTLKKQVDQLTLEQALIAKSYTGSILQKVLKLAKPSVQILKQLDEPTPFELDWFETVFREFKKSARDADLPREIQILLGKVRIVNSVPIFPEAALVTFNDALAATLGTNFAIAAVEKAQIIMAEMYAVAAEASAAALAITPALTAVDLATIEFLKDVDIYFLGSMYDRSIRIRINEIAAEVLTQGLGEAELARRMNAELGAVILRNGETGINTIANDTINRARNYSRINQYSKVGIETYEFVAILDEKTSPICRFMNGRTFSVESAKGLVDDTLNFGEVNDDTQNKFKQIRPWGNVDTKRFKLGQNAIFIKDGRGKKSFLPDSGFKFTKDGSFRAKGDPSNSKTNNALANKNFQFPPLHAHCRSTVVISETEVDRLTGTIIVTKLEGNTISQQFETIAENSANSKKKINPESFMEIRQEVGEAVGIEKGKLETVDKLMESYRRSSKSGLGLRFQALNHIANGFSSTSQFAKSLSESQRITFRKQIRVVQRDPKLLEAYQVSRATNRAGTLESNKNNTITVYRGFVGQAARELIKAMEDGRTKIGLRVMALSQWSRSRKAAELFVQEFGNKDGVIVRNEIRVEDGVFSYQVCPLLSKEFKEVLYGDTSGVTEIVVENFSKVKVNKAESDIVVDKGKNNNWIWKLMNLK